MYGRGYVIDHVLALLRHEAKETQYRAYVTDVLRLIGENVSKIAGGSYVAVRWADLLTKKVEDERSGDEIAEDVIRRIGLKLKGEENG